MESITFRVWVDNVAVFCFPIFTQIYFRLLKCLSGHPLGVFFLFLAPFWSVLASSSGWCWSRMWKAAPWAQCLACPAPVLSDDEGFLSSPRVSGSKRKECFPFTPFAFIPHKNRKHNKQRKVFHWNFAASIDLCVAQMKEAPDFPYHLRHPATSISSSLSSHRTTRHWLEITTKVYQVRFKVSLGLSARPFNGPRSFQ